MPLTIYNSLSREKQVFEPTEPGRVKMYVCGPTVYDSCHIGHARSVVVFDVIYRYLAACGYEVTYVRNFTDIDDKIINRANELGVTTTALAEKYIAEFHEDMEALHVLRPTIEPRATEHMAVMIRVIERLVEKGFAYPSDGDVFFSVDRFEGYGKLSGRKLEEMEAGARVGVDTRKRNPFDFVLWKSSKPGEPAWESPWGAGRPGWHIECSAMSTDYLGENIDIHGGGKDLIFPHHENEIAQSEAAFGKSFVRYWIHNGFVNINQEKMSKSLGNFLTIRDILNVWHPEALRLFLLSNHYRSPLDFTDQAMKEAAAGLDKMYALLERAQSRLGRFPRAGTEGRTDYWCLFCRAMEDDFNTAQGIGVLFEAVRSANRMLDENREAEDSSAEAVCVHILKIGKILGILSQSPRDYFAVQKRSRVEKHAADTQFIEKLVREREAARKAKDFKTADRVREELQSMNVVVEDRPDGTVWKLKD